MNVLTSMFGEIQIDESKIIRFEEGIPGFQDEKEFTIILSDEESPLHWLQSLTTPDLSFIILNPFVVYDDYEFTISDATIQKLDIKDDEQVVVYTIVSVPEDMDKITTNLLGPIIINQENMKAKQVILEDSKYSTKHYVLKQKA